MKNTPLSTTLSSFEAIKRVDPQGGEYWFSSELMKILDYQKKERFTELIERAKESCKKTGYSVQNHFREVGKMIKTGQSFVF